MRPLLLYLSVPACQSVCQSAFTVYLSPQKHNYLYGQNSKIEGFPEFVFFSFFLGAIVYAYVFYVYMCFRNSRFVIACVSVHQHCLLLAGSSTSVEGWIGYTGPFARVPCRFYERVIFPIACQNGRRIAGETEVDL